jgi:hypothetical protein
MSEPFASLFTLIEPLENGDCQEAQNIYVTTGEYLPLVSELKRELEKTNLAIPDFDWLAHIDEARPYLQNPEQLEHASLDEIKRLVTVAVQSERLNKSLLPYLCSSGFTLALLRRIRALCA